MVRCEELPPLHPGTILAEDFLEPLRLSGRALACALQVSHSRVAMILRGESAITADTAVRLGRYFDTSPWFWMNLQVRFDLDMAERTTPHPAARIRPADVGSDLAWLTGDEGEGKNRW